MPMSAPAFNCHAACRSFHSSSLELSHNNTTMTAAAPKSTAQVRRSASTEASACAMHDGGALSCALCSCSAQQAVPPGAWPLRVPTTVSSIRHADRGVDRWPQGALEARIGGPSTKPLAPTTPSSRAEGDLETKASLPQRVAPAHASVSSTEASCSEPITPVSDASSAPGLPKGESSSLQRTASTTATGTDGFVVEGQAAEDASEAVAKPSVSVKECLVRPLQRQPQCRCPVATTLDGRIKSAEWLQELRASVDEVTAALERSPGLCIIAVGSRPDSQLYVSKKQEVCEQVWQCL
jgi:hypothetical protein